MIFLLAAKRNIALVGTGDALDRRGSFFYAKTNLWQNLRIERIHVLSMGFFAIQVMNLFFVSGVSNSE